ncbi:hypothetical protein IWQ60_011984, partial [Tieghemiomyces parasiticus]
ACLRAAEVLANGGSCITAVEAAIKVLEDDEITNAGFGSNLNLNGAIECDASLMEGQTGSFGAVTGVS